jgi:RND family efflux transporter MFP subunit
MMKKWIIIAIGLLVLAGYFAWRTPAKPLALPGSTPVQIVKTVKVVAKSLEIQSVANGYVTPINSVDVHPRIQQIVRSIHVKEGQEVAAGQLLFTLDSRGDNSTVDKAKAQLARDSADLEDATIALKRNQELLIKSFVSQSVVDSARSKVESLKATIRSDQAAIDASNISLDYNQINASISGRIGAISVHPGSLAQPGGLPLVTITQFNPITVSFSVPEKELVNLSANSPQQNKPVMAMLADGRQLNGQLIFIDNAVDQQSGTLRLKAQFDNAKRLLWPGAFVTVHFVSHNLPNALVVPVQAVVTGPNNQFVYLVQADNHVKKQVVTVLNIDSEQAAISGVAMGDRVVVEGSQNLRPNSLVKEAEPVATPGAKSAKSRAP